MAVCTWKDRHTLNFELGNLGQKNAAIFPVYTVFKNHYKMEYPHLSSVTMRPARITHITHWIFDVWRALIMRGYYVQACCTANSSSCTGLQQQSIALVTLKSNAIRPNSLTWNLIILQSISYKRISAIGYRNLGPVIALVGLLSDWYLQVELVNWNLPVLDQRKEITCTIRLPLLGVYIKHKTWPSTWITGRDIWVCYAAPNTTPMSPLCSCSSALLGLHGQVWHLIYMYVDL